MSVTPDSVNLRSGDTVTLSAAVFDAAGHSLAGRLVTWATSDITLGTIAPSGLLTTIWHDDATTRELVVIATCEGVADTTPVVVIPVPVAKVEIAAGNAGVLVGAVQQLNATVRDSADRALNGRVIVWTGSDPGTALVSPFGLVTGVAPGDVTVSATSDGAADTVTVSVSNVLVTVLDPKVDTLVGDTVRVRATVASVFQIAAVVATLGSSTVSMTYSTFFREWTGALPITDEAFGAQDLQVTATDVFGTAEVVVVPVIHDPPPAVDVVAPALGAVASPTVMLTVGCSDRNAAGCRSVSAAVEAGPVLATGTSSLDATVSLAPYDGQKIKLLFTGTDSAGQSTTKTLEVWVFLATGLQRVAEVQGQVLDFDAGRTLYTVRIPDPVRSDYGTDVLHIRAPGGSIAVAFNSTGRMVTKAFLGPSGAIFTSTTGVVTGDALHEFRNGSTNTLALGYVSTLAAEGPYAAWVVNNARQLYLMDLVVGTTTVIANDAGNTAYDVTASGHVAYWDTAYQVAYVPFSGSRVTLSTGPLWNTYPLTDGSMVVYRKSTLCCVGQMWQVYAAPVTGGEIPLSAVDSVAPWPNQEYAVEGGWIAFAQRSASGELQVWSRSPAAVTTQVSFFGASSRIEALDASGRIVFFSGTTRYLSAPPYTTVSPLGPAIGSVKLRGGQFVILLGGVVFAVQ